jgi:hypothetical protein
MRLLSFIWPDGRASVGRLDEGGCVVDLSSLCAHAPAAGALRSLLAALDGAPVATTTHRRAEVFDLAEVAPASGSRPVMTAVSPQFTLIVITASRGWVPDVDDAERGPPCP